MHHLTHGSIAPLPSNSAPVADTVDLAEVGRTIRRQWRALSLCVVGGLAIATGVVLYAPRQFEGATSILIRSSDPSASALAKLGGDAGLGGLLAGGMRIPIETELQVLQSRVLIGQVVDSLRLQVTVRTPRGLATASVVRDADLPGSFKKRTYEFTRSADGRTYRVTGRGMTATVAPGGAVQLPVGRLTLADRLPTSFTVQVLDREDAITRFQKSLSVGKAATGSEVIRVTYRGADSTTAASATNAIAATYLARRKTVDRGMTEHRVEFLTAQLDTIARNLSAAEQALRMHQERSGVIDAPTVGKLQLEQAATLRQSIGAVDVEEGALTHLVAQVGSGRVTPRQLAAYPSFLKSPGINELLTRLSELETDRTRLLERRLETDPEVVAISQSIRELEGQLLPIATGYVTSLRRQRSDMARQLDTLQGALSTFPASAQSSVRLQRDVLRLGQIHGALQAQLVEARLTAVTEGGDVRQLDIAAVPKKVAFPAPALTMGVGLGGGLFLGLIAALVIGSFGRYTDDPRLIERTTGVRALPLAVGAPLLLPSGPGVRTTLVVPLDSRVPTAHVAERIAQSALRRMMPATVLDLTGDVMPPEGVDRAIERLEQEHALVVVRLPELTSDTTAAALHPDRPVYLVAGRRRVDRERLSDTVDTLRRLDIPCAGVILDDGIQPAGVRGQLSG